ncbi:MAG: sigE 15 [Marmoricola sp.]|nr:sigE 15 [Marmoricola sp.]
MNTITADVTQEPVIDASTALTELYAAHYGRLVRLGVLLLRDQGLAEEVVQDAFVAMHRRWSRIDQGRAPAYLTTSVVNGSRSALRHRTVVARFRPEVPRTEPGADVPVLAGAHRTAVLDALAGLPTRQREVLVLRFYLDLSERDIATTLGISPGAVKSHASRGAAALRLTLAEELS